MPIISLISDVNVVCPLGQQFVLQMLKRVLSAQKILMQCLLSITWTRSVTDCHVEVYVEVIAEERNWFWFWYTCDLFYYALPVETLLLWVLE